MSRFIYRYQSATPHTQPNDETHHVVNDGEVVFVLVVAGVAIGIPDLGHLIP